jgi:hypothetical protein
MSSCLRGLSGGLVLLALGVLAGVALARPPVKSPLPGPASWDVEALSRVFRVERTEYDDRTSKVRWHLSAKESVRTADFVRSLERENRLTFVFLDADGREEAVVQVGESDLQGLPRDRLLKAGTKLELTLELPAGFRKTAKVILKRGRLER